MPFISILLAVLATLIPTLSYAASPIGNVGTATVNDGAISFEVRAGYTEDDDRSSADQRIQFREHIDVGLNDWYAVRLIAAQDKRQGDNLEHSSVTFENRIQLVERRDHGWDGGVRLIYGQRDGDKMPHEIDLRWMMQVPFGDEWEWRHNTVVEHDIGENSRSGFMLEFRNQLAKTIEPPADWIKKLAVGVEMFNDFGRLRDLSGYDNQDHQLGPVMKGSFHNGMYFQLGYRAGISDAGTDHLAKLFIGMKY